jgi:DNA-binding XRE family transcriptional regulator
MKTLTLTEVINKERKNKSFNLHFEREMLINHLAKIVVTLRKKSGFTQEELARKVGTSQPVIARLEGGKDNRMPSLELLTKLAIATNAKLKIIFEQ